jgi:hypothetical protein
VSYSRFWLRTSVVFCPLLAFVLIFGAHLDVWRGILYSAAASAAGYLLILPLIGLFGTVDRSMWSVYEEQLRAERRKQKMREWGEVVDEDD